MGGRGAASSGGGGGKGSSIEQTYRNGKSGGVVYTEKSRIEISKKSKNERQKYDKEQNIAKKLADDGHAVFHLDDSKLKDGSYDALVDGIKTDFKETGSANNIGKYSKHAIEKQKAEQVVFNFTKFNGDFQNEINKLKEKGIHGYYYKPDDKTHHRF